MQQPDRNPPGMRFRRVGGSYQLNISSEADLRSLLDLPPEKLRIGGAILLALGIIAALLGICLRS